MLVFISFLLNLNTFKTKLGNASDYFIDTEIKYPPISIQQALSIILQLAFSFSSSHLVSFCSQFCECIFLVIGFCLPSILSSACRLSSCSNCSQLRVRESEGNASMPCGPKIRKMRNKAEMGERKRQTEGVIMWFMHSFARSARMFNLPTHKSFRE